MRVIVYAGFGSLREARWEGALGVAPLDGDVIALPGDQSYRIERRTFRLDQKLPVLELYVR